MHSVVYVYVCLDLICIFYELHEKAHRCPYRNCISKIARSHGRAERSKIVYMKETVFLRGLVKTV